MALLTRRALSTSLAAFPHADPAPRRVKILQIGDGEAQPCIPASRKRHSVASGYKLNEHAIKIEACDKILRNQGETQRVAIEGDGPFEVRYIVEDGIEGKFWLVSG